VSVEANKAVVLKGWEYTRLGDHAALESIYDDDVTCHGPGGERLAGRDAVIAARASCISAFPGLSIHVEDVFGEGDRVFCRVRLEGTNTRAFMAMPATGNHVQLRWLMTVSRLEAGRVVEEWSVFDRMDFFAQLGAPQPEREAVPH